MKLHTCLNYGGNCRQAFEFYQQHLGGKITVMMSHADSPALNQVAPELKETIVHARMDLGDTELLANDVPPEHFQPMRSAYLSLAVKTSAEAERIYTLLSEGGQVFMPLAENFFAHRFAMLRDRFGTSWMLLHQREQS